jgi:hypothetical protein
MKKSVCVSTVFPDQCNNYIHPGTCTDNAEIMKSCSNNTNESSTIPSTPKEVTDFVKAKAQDPAHPGPINSPGPCSEKPRSQRPRVSL